MPKVVLEFNYPEDENECRRALNGSKAFECLWEIRREVQRYTKNDIDPVQVIDRIHDLVTATLAETGDDV